MKKILFMCGSLNQTTMLHQISEYLEGYDKFFTAYYCDGIEKAAQKLGLLNFSVLGGKFKERTEAYLRANNLPIDYEGKKHNYDMVVVCSDLIIPKNLLGKKMVLVQEGMTDPENFSYYLVKKFNIPRYFASTSTTGLSDAYSKFCVASEGYRDLFIKKGVKAEKIKVTGIPNFDDCKQYLNNDFPHSGYVLVCTSDSRETYKFENRKKFILRAREIAGEKPLIFKLHPNENVPRATREIRRYAPEALVYSVGNTNHMIANCETLITKFSSVVYVGIALGKEVYSDFDLEELKKLTPIQNGGTSAKKISEICKSLIEEKETVMHYQMADRQNLKGSYNAAG